MSLIGYLAGADEEDNILLMEIHDKAPDEVIAVYKEAQPCHFPNDNDRDKYNAGDSLCPRLGG